MLGRSSGLTLIEIMVAMLIIGLMATIAVPRLFRQQQSTLDTFVIELQAIVQSGIYEAQHTGLLHRVFVDIKNGHIQLESAKNADVHFQDTSASFTPTGVTYAKTGISVPEDIAFQTFIINGKNELASGFTTKTIWFFIDPQGLVQQVHMQLKDTQTNHTITLATNPFSGQLLEHKD